MGGNNTFNCQQLPTANNYRQLDETFFEGAYESLLEMNVDSRGNYGTDSNSDKSRKLGHIHGTGTGHGLAKLVESKCQTER